MNKNYQKLMGLRVYPARSWKIASNMKREDSFQRNVWKLTHIKFVDCDFISTLYRDHEKEMQYIWVYVIGPEDVAKNFEFSVQIPSDGDKHQLFRNVVSPIDVKFDNVIKKGSVCCLTDFTMSQILDPDGKKITYHLKIEICKPTEGGRKRKMSEPSQKF